MKNLILTLSIICLFACKKDEVKPESKPVNITIKSSSKIYYTRSYTDSQKTVTKSDSTVTPYNGEYIFVVGTNYESKTNLTITVHTKDSNLKTITVTSRLDTLYSSSSNTNPFVANIVVP